MCLGLIRDKVGDDVRAARQHFLEGDFGPFLAQEIGDVVRDGPLPGQVRAGGALRVDARDGDELLQEFNDIARMTGGGPHGIEKKRDRLPDCA